MATVTIDKVYRELQSLKRDIEAVKYALIPEEKISPQEMRELGEIKKEMESGKEKGLKDVFGN